MNIWVADLADGVSGYAQMPGGPDETDGIVIDYDFFGIRESESSPYDEGKTLTHLVGSYLGLHELWNETVRCSDDFVNDTPVHNAPNFAVTRYRHISGCSGNPAEMFMNFMDNTDDVGMYMFTFGQKVRLLGMLSPGGPRNGLLLQEGKCVEVEEKQNLAFETADRNTLNNQLQIRAFPNPAKNQVTFEAYFPEEVSGKIEVYNSVGMLVHSIMLQGSVNMEQFQVNTSNWMTGSYFVKLNAGDQQSFCRLIITSE